jgi:hypothetical protein
MICHPAIKLARRLMRHLKAAVFKHRQRCRIGHMHVEDAGVPRIGAMAGDMDVARGRLDLALAFQDRPLPSIIRR